MRRTATIIAALLCTAAADSRAVKIERNSAVLEFTYEWPAEASAIPALDRKFQAEAAALYRRSLILAREDHKIYQQQQRGSIADFYSKQWTTAGESRKLLSLKYQHSAYTGGAHPNTDYGVLLWDRDRRRQITMSNLFLRTKTFNALMRALIAGRWIPSVGSAAEKIGSSAYPSSTPARGSRTSPSLRSTGTGTDGSTRSPSSPHLIWRARIPRANTKPCFRSLDS